MITMFLLPDINLRLRPKILDLKPGTRIVSNTFTMGDWKPDETADRRATAATSSWCTALLWIVPAKVAGTLTSCRRASSTLKQEFQMLSGTLSTDGRTVPVEGKVRGEEITLHRRRPANITAAPTASSSSCTEKQRAPGKRTPRPRS